MNQNEFQLKFGKMTDKELNEYLKGFFLKMREMTPEQQEEVNFIFTLLDKRNGENRA